MKLNKTKKDAHTYGVKSKHMEVDADCFRNLMQRQLYVSFIFNPTANFYSMVFILDGRSEHVP